MCSNSCKQPTLIYCCNNQSSAWQHFSGNCGCPGFSESSLTCCKSSRSYQWLLLKEWTFSLSAFIYQSRKKEPCLFSMDLVTINSLILLRLWKEVCSHCLFISFFFLRCIHCKHCALVPVNNTFYTKKSFSLQIEKLTINIKNLFVNTQHSRQ